jgi:hypothetical protein
VEKIKTHILCPVISVYNNDICEIMWKKYYRYKTNTQILKESKITPILDKLLEYKRNWIQHVNTRAVFF